MPCPSATFTVWASAWLVGAAAPDDVLDALAPWADAHDVGYFAWTWDTWRNCSALIRDYATAAPFSTYASFVKAHYTAKRAAARPLPKP